MNSAWHVTCFYYHRDEKEDDDRIGNHILVKLVLPLFETLRAQSFVSAVEFERFALGGNHIQLRTLFDPSQRAPLEAMIGAAVEEYREAYADFFKQQTMVLNGLSTILNRSWPAGAQLHHPGTYTMQLLGENSMTTIFESDSIGAADAAWQDFVCQMWLLLLKQSAPRTLRMTILRLWVIDVMRLLNISDYDQCRCLSLITAHWTGYFGLVDHLVPYFKEYHQRKAQYQDYFAQWRQYQSDTAALLPPAVQTFYRFFIRQCAERLRSDHLFAYNPNGILTDASLLRVMGSFHLNHNRLAIGIYKEILWAYIVKEHFQLQLIADQLHSIDREVARLMTLIQTLNVGSTS